MPNEVVTKWDLLDTVMDLQGDLLIAIDELDWSRERVGDSDDFPVGWTHEILMAIDADNMPDDVDVDPERVLDYQKPVRAMKAIQEVLDMVALAILHETPRPTEDDE
jgi:hypothetical protein